MVCASRPAARLLRTAAPFELPGWYFGTTRPIIRLVVDLIIRVVLYYQPKADNPADNPAVSFVVIYMVKARVRGGLAMCIFPILAFSGCGAGAPRIFLGGYDSVEPIFCHYADVSRLGT